MIGFQYKPFTLCQQDDKILCVGENAMRQKIKKSFIVLLIKKFVTLQLMTIKVIGCINKAKCKLAISIFKTFD